jgi:hypothetical protein
LFFFHHMHSFHSSYNKFQVKKYSLKIKYYLSSKANSKNDTLISFSLGYWGISLDNGTMEMDPSGIYFPLL